MRSDLALLLDMYSAARKIQRFTHQMTRPDFDQHELVQIAVLYELQIIGEAARMVTQAYKTQHPEIAWNAIQGMRNRLVHEYFDVNLNLVWNTVQENIPLLVDQLQPLIPPAP
jgi:uncharacterized protein with HEPN domain